MNVFQCYEPNYVVTSTTKPNMLFMDLIFGEITDWLLNEKVSICK